MELEYDLFKSREARDEGIAQVTENNVAWFDSAMAYIALMPVDWIGTGEDIRRLSSRVCGLPKSPHAWGSLIRFAVKRGHIHETGRWVQMKDINSHG